MACPDKKVGSVRIIHFDKGSKIINVNAHQSNLAALALNNEGTLLATASDKVILINDIFKLRFSISLTSF